MSDTGQHDSTDTGQHTSRDTAGDSSILPQKVCPVCSTGMSEHLMDLEPAEGVGHQWRCLCGHTEPLTPGEYTALFGES